MKLKVFITGDGKDTHVAIYFLESPKAMREGAGDAPFRKSRGDAMNCFCNIGVSCLEPHRSIHLPNKTLFRSMVLLQTPKNHLRKRPFSVTAPCAFYMNPWEFSTLLGCLVYEGVSHPTHSHFVGRWLVLQPHHLRQVTVVLPVFQRSVPEWLGSWHGWSWLVHGFYKRGPLGSL